MKTNEHIYWNQKGKYQIFYNKLTALIPEVGEVKNPEQNQHLETLRKASNAYYDLYNNGLCNRAKEFREVFGFGGTWIAKKHYPDCPQLEEKLNDIILLAAIEQGLIKFQPY